MADFKEVAIIEVDNENFNDLWPTLLLAIQNATFVAVDAELSGLGSRKLLFAKSIDDRYKEMCEVARTRSIISLGLSCFNIQPSGEEHDKAANSDDLEPDHAKTKELCFEVQTFNIMLLCNENYVVEPISLKFLVDHGFDFNKQYARGIPYYRGNDKATDKEYQSARQLFTEIIISGVPIVFHNALVDLIFLYQNFYANTPSSIQTFVADLTEVFTGGVYDTKYMAEFKARTSASYLEYIFRKCQRDNVHRKETGLCHTSITFLRYPASMAGLVMLPCALDDLPTEGQRGKINACVSYAAHGWCSLGNHCPNSHDIDFILDHEDQLAAKKRKKRQRRKHTLTQHHTGGKSQSTDVKGNEDLNSDMETSPKDTKIEKIDLAAGNSNLDTVQIESESEVNISTSSITTVSKTGGHRAGFDSFMTGFAFAAFISKYGKYGRLSRSTKLSELGFEEYKNKVALSGKDIPLLIQKGNFAKISKDHKEKQNKIRNSAL